MIGCRGAAQLPGVLLEELPVDFSMMAEAEHLLIAG